MGWLVGPILVYGTTLMGGTMVLRGYARLPASPTASGGSWRTSASAISASPRPSRARFMADPRLRRRRASIFRRYRIFVLHRRSLDAGSLALAVRTHWRRSGCRSSTSPAAPRWAASLARSSPQPIKPCSFTRPVPGTDAAAILDEAGRESPPGEVGELVMRRAPIGLTQGLWHDDAALPRRATGRRWPGVWHHGDFAMRDARRLLLRARPLRRHAEDRRQAHWPLRDRGAAAGDRPRSREAAAIGVPDPVKGTAIVCVCVRAATSVPEGEDAGRACRRP